MQWGASIPLIKLFEMKASRFVIIALCFTRTSDEINQTCLIFNMLLNNIVLKIH